MFHTSSFVSFFSLLIFITSARVDQLFASNGASCSICESVKAAEGSICSFLKELMTVIKDSKLKEVAGFKNLNLNSINFLI